MNPWDLLTWVSATFLAGSATVIFVFFAKDIRRILRGGRAEHPEDP